VQASSALGPLHVDGRGSSDDVSLESRRPVVAVVAIALIVVAGMALWGVRAPLVAISVVVNLFTTPH
jgi:hypothetical protein